MVKKFIEHEDLRIQSINSDGIVIKDKFTRRPVLVIPSLKNLGFRREK